MKHDAVQKYYDHFGEREWNRLENPDDGIVEYAVTCRMLEKHLLPNSRILDIGGGPGQYAIWLAEHGHIVTLADLSPELVAIGQEKVKASAAGANVTEIVVADACDLSRWKDASFDAVLNLGPFYHLTEEEDRNKAVSELRRVLQPGGLAFVAFMPYCAYLRRTLVVPDERHHLAQPEFVSRILDEGVFINDIEGRFTGGYGARPETIAPFFEKNGFSTLTLLAAEGIAGSIQRVVADLKTDDPDLYETVLDLIVQTADDPSILGMAGHLLYIGRKQ